MEWGDMVDMVEWEATGVDMADSEGMEGWEGTGWEWEGMAWAACQGCREGCLARRCKLARVNEAALSADTMLITQPHLSSCRSLTQRMESGTQATFELISSIVGAFGGFAQMLESTFMATHSSFFAMVGVADQFASLRNYLGQVLSIFALARWLKGLLLKVTGRAPPVDLNAKDFQDFATAKANGQPGKAKPSKRPLVVFFLAVVGLPYLMGKLVRLITQRQEAERLRLEAEQQAGQQAGHLSLPDGASIDPSKLSFVRALYTYESSDPLELSLRPNDIVAVLSKVDPSSGQESSWWRGRTRDGRIGWFPSTYVESLETVKQRAAGKGVAEEEKAVEGQAAASPAATTPAAVSVKS